MADIELVIDQSEIVIEIAQAPGADGSNGADGVNGSNGLSAYEIWLAAGNDGTEQEFLDSLKGADGANGTNGTNGSDGQPGADAETSMTSTSFTGSIKLDKIAGRDYGINEITTNSEITLDSTDIKDGGNAQIGLLGDGSHTPGLTAFNKYDSNGVDYDNTSSKLNVFAFFRWLGKVYWNILDQYDYTPPDETAPVLNSVSISAITQIAAQINATSNENATFYWGVYANGATAPTYAQLVAGTGALVYGDVSLTASTPGNDAISGLTYSINYDVYYAAVDGSANHTDPVLIEFATIARTQLTTPNPTGSQLDADTARFTWDNITGNAGYAYRTRVNGGSWSGYSNLSTDVVTIDVDGTTGQTIGFELIAKGNNTTTVDSASSTEDSVTLTVNQAPVASNVTVSGTTGLGDTLTGDYDYSDNESNAEGTSTFRWLRDDVAIGGETALTHVIVLADQGHTLKFEVTPVAVAGTSPGTPVASSGTAIPANAAPYFDSISGTAPSGTTTVGQTLTAPTLTYHDADGDSEGAHTYQWYRADTAGGTYSAITSANALTYMLQAADEGKYLKFGATPVAATGTSPGTEVLSAASAQVISSITYEYLLWNSIQSGLSMDTANHILTLNTNGSYLRGYNAKKATGNFELVVDYEDVLGVDRLHAFGLDATSNYDSYLNWDYSFVRQTNAATNAYTLSTNRASLTLSNSDKLKIKRVISGSDAVWTWERLTGGSWVVIYTTTNTDIADKVIKCQIGDVSGCQIKYARCNNLTAS